MAAFTACLIAAGAVLSLLARVQGLVLVLVGLGLVIAAASLLGPALGTGYGLPVTLLVAVVALQAGYGLGVILRASVGRRAARLAARDRPEFREKAPDPGALRGSHEGGPLNHP